jgi:uncharacterized protein (DUF927 family)
MLHYGIFDDPTYTYLIRLKVANRLWYQHLIKCGQKSPKLVAVFLKEAEDNLKYAQLVHKDVNIFQICKAAKSGLLDGLGSFLPEGVWINYRKSILHRLKNDNIV